MLNDSKNTTNAAQSANFREISIGDIAPGILYRSSHPIKENKQDKIISMLAAKTRISSVINLHDTDSGLFSKSFFAPWYDILYKCNRVIALGMDFSVTSENFKKKFKKALQFIINTPGPYLIHCHAGVDRTGYICMVLESFMGAKLDEVIEDYLKSFNSIFESSIYTSQKTDSITAVKVLSAMDSTQIINHDNLQQIAENYLKNTIGLTTKEINQLKKTLKAPKTKIIS